MSEENWCTFSREFEGRSVLISANLSYCDIAPVCDQPVCTRLLFDLPMSDRGDVIALDWDMLELIDDHLKRVDALEVGRTTGADGREYYFYSDDGQRTEKKLAEVMTSVPDRAYSIQSEHDESWFLWADNLRPTKTELRRINDNLVVRQVAENGDDGTAVRPVRHWVYFDDKATADRFVEKAELVGFELVVHDYVGGDDGSRTERVVILDKQQSLANGLISETTLQLTQLAESLQGRYDGWETECVTDQ